MKKIDKMLKHIRVYILFSLGCILLACSPKDNPKEIFIKSELAARKLQEAEFVLTRVTHSSGARDSFDLKVFVKRNPSDTAVKAMVRIEQADSSAIIYNNGDFKLIDFKRHSILVPDSSTSAMKLMKLMSEYYTSVMSFSSNSDVENIAQSVKSLGKENVNGEECYHLYSKKNNKGMDVEVNYFFSTRDMLLRKFSAKSSLGGQNISEIIYYVSKIKTNLKNPIQLFDYKAVNDIESYKTETMSK